MSTTASTLGGDTLTRVTDEAGESTWERVARLRGELGWTQVELADRAGVTEETVSNVERGPGKRGPRPSTRQLLEVLEAEMRRRQAPPAPADRGPDILEVLARQRAEDVRVRRIGPNRKVRWFQFGIPDEDATPDEIAQALEEMHRNLRHEDGPNG